MSLFDVVVVDDARRRGGDLEAAVVVGAVHVGSGGFAGMMIEPEAGAGHEWKVREDVIRRDVDLPVLHVLRMDELDAFDRYHLLEQHGAGKTIEIRSRNEAHS